MDTEVVRQELLSLIPELKQLESEVDGLEVDEGEDLMLKECQKEFKATVASLEVLIVCHLTAYNCYGPKFSVLSVLYSSTGLSCPTLPYNPA